jgi:hypothetical protein
LLFDANGTLIQGRRKTSVRCRQRRRTAPRAARSWPASRKPGDGRAARRENRVRPALADLAVQIVDDFLCIVDVGASLRHANDSLARFINSCFRVLIIVG